MKHERNTQRGRVGRQRALKSCDGWRWESRSAPVDMALMRRNLCSAACEELAAGTGFENMHVYVVARVS